MQREIVWSLEEAGAETIGTVTATLGNPDQEQFDKALAGLLNLGLIREQESDGGCGRRVTLVLTDKGREMMRK